MLKFLKNLLAAAPAPLIDTPASYPGTMAEIVEYLVLLQASGPGNGRSSKGNLFRIAVTLSEDPYCLGYLTGMFDALCQHAEVPVTERRLIIRSACSLLFHDLLGSCTDSRSAATIEAAAFSRSLTLAQDPEFLRGRFDGCSELVRYTATKEHAYLPSKLHGHLKQLATV